MKMTASLNWLRLSLLTVRTILVNFIKNLQNTLATWVCVLLQIYYSNWWKFKRHLERLLFEGESAKGILKRVLKKYQASHLKNWEQHLAILSGFGIVYYLSSQWILLGNIHSLPLNGSHETSHVWKNIFICCWS